MDCRECRQNNPDKNCIDCGEIIDGSFLAERPGENYPVSLENLDKDETYTAELELISPIGLALKSSVPPGRYRIKLAEHLEVLASLAQFKGRSPYQGFDIISVLREDGEYSRLRRKDFKIFKKPAGDLIDEITEELPEDIKDAVRERLKAEVEKSQILDCFEVGDVLRYERGRLKELTVGREKNSLPEECLVEFMEEAIKRGEYRRDTYVDPEGERIYDLHALPLDFQSGGIIVMDITEVLAVERRRKKEEIALLKNVISAVTGNKLQLLDQKEMEKVLDEGKLLFQLDLNSSEDIAVARDKAKKLLERFHMQSDDIRHTVLCISEAVTNAIKHAGEGRFLIFFAGGTLKLVIKDQGSGIDFTRLPSATLMKDYSSSSTFSLGNGFTVMLRFVDRLLLATDSQGTTIILEKEL